MDYTDFMKILIISNLYPPYVLGGYEILCGQVVQYLKDRGHQIQVLTSDHQSSASDCAVTRTLRLYQGFDKKASFMRFARFRAATFNSRETARMIQETRPEVIFIWSLLRLTPAPARVAEKSAIPVVYTFNDENVMSFAGHRFSLSPKKLIHWMLDTFVTPGITLNGLAFRHSTCISKILKRNLIAKGLPIANSQVIYQGIPIERFPPRPQAGSRHTPIRILYAGQLHAYKGVHTLISALTQVSKQSDLPSFSLTVVGKGPEDYTASLKESAVNAGFPVDFRGLVPHAEMPAVYQEHDVFVFPSIWEEPFGLTHLEAMASGLPVVSTANGGQGEFLVDEGNALTFKPEDVPGLARQLVRLLTDDALYARLSQEGRATATQGFSFSRYVDELEGLLQNACKGERR
jgi:glycosyltransferase involved in cell wall biosynthesis